MNGYYNSPIGKVPPDWSTELIGNFFDIQQGKQLSAATRKGDNVKKFLRTANIFWGRIDLDNLDQMHFSENDAARMDLKENDLLVCEGGDIGRTAICRVDLPEVYYQNHLHRLRPKNNEVVPEFFMYWMWYVWNLTDHYGGAGNKTTIPNLSKAKLSGLHFAKPSRDEQKNIAFILSALQKAIQKQEEIIKTTTALKKSLLNKLFTEGTKGEPLKQTEVGMIPESWKVVSLGDVCERISEGYHPDKTGSKKYVGLEHIESGAIKIKLCGKESDVRSSKSVFKSGQILYGKLRPYLDKCVVADFDGVCSTDILVFNGLRDVTNDFLVQLLHTEQFLAFAKSSTTGVQHPRTSWNVLKDFRFALPTDEHERNLIAHSLQSLNLKADNHKRKQDIYQNLFNTLLNDLMTGLIRVHDIDFNFKPKQ